MTRTSAELGRANAAAGKGWEVALARVLAELQQARLLGWVHHPEPAWRKVPGRGFVCAKKALTDFLGVVRGRARVFAIEAKSSDEESDRGRLYRREVLPHQIVVLDETADAGGVALLAVEFRRGGAPVSWHLVPWRAVPWACVKSAPSIDAAAVARWRVRDLRADLERLIVGSAS